MANLGYVGLGAMGGRMAARLLAQGHVVTGFNRTRPRAEWLVERGMRWAESPRAVAEASDVTFVMVTDSQALDAVASGPDGLVAGMQPGRVLVDMSTVSARVRTMLTPE
jgi:3-hydroxyisobutyrate dehydrogenase-like beta-hydroxyacid dehydrogenase